MDLVEPAIDCLEPAIDFLESADHFQPETADDTLNIGEHDLPMKLRENLN